MKARKDTILKAIERTEREAASPLETMGAWRLTSDERREFLGGDASLRYRAEQRLKILREMIDGNEST